MNHKQNNRHNGHRLSTRLAMIVALSATLALGACGGGNIDTPEGKVDQTIPASEALGASAGLTLQAADAKPSTQTIAALKKGARLNAAELETIAKTGVLPAPFEGKLLSGAGENQSEPAFTPNDGTTEKSGAMPKSSASRIAVYRFYNTRTGSHFFTTSVAERDNVQTNLPFMRYEGPAFYAASSFVPGLSPVHRFYNTLTGVHFYTISEAERAHVTTTLPQFAYEGIAYYASTTAGIGYTPLYRFFVSARGFHFYTASLTERNRIVGGLVPGYSYEGTGYYVLGDDWQALKLPHTGVSSSQCYASGSDDEALVPCHYSAALNLNPQQDGHRADVNPMSYSQIISGYYGTFPNFLPLYFPKTDCVRDDVTGLIWEGKTTSGVRNRDNLYTNHRDNRDGDTSAYVSMVNASNLCGSDDWRLPTRNELLSLVDFGPDVAPAININWFTTESSTRRYWTSQYDATDSSNAWTVNFDGGDSRVRARSTALPVRLVRGSAPAIPRFTFATVPYQGDWPNNVVNDAWTGLQWRRCEQGRVWIGTSCVGESYRYTHGEALAHASFQTGWRMPNIKELASLTDLRRIGNVSINPFAFPNSGRPLIWATTPHTGITYGSRFVDFDTGDVVIGVTRTYRFGVRLVYAGP